MTRKDYVKTAEILNSYVLNLHPAVAGNIVKDFSEYFASDNPHFNETKFREAVYKN